MVFSPRVGVVVESLLGLPRWLLLGVSVGALVSLVVAATFVVASRMFPDGNESRSTWPSSEGRRRAEIRRYLDAIGERFAEDTRAHGEPVAFYLPHRDVAVTFDARTFYALEHTSTYAILMEHEMPGIALGNRLPFETPDVEFGDTGRGSGHRSRRSNRSVDPAETAYAVLGLPSGASEDAVQQAYRRRVKEVHPDQGGDEAEFKRVREAYDTAKQHASS
jgi:hypothetical protein